MRDSLGVGDHIVSRVLSIYYQKIPSTRLSTNLPCFALFVRAVSLLFLFSSKMRMMEIECLMNDHLFYKFLFRVPTVSLLGPQGDYFAVELVNGHVYLHLDLGSGSVKVKATSRRIDDGTWHEITISRNGKSGRATVDGASTDFVTPGSLISIFSFLLQYHMKNILSSTIFRN